MYRDGKGVPKSDERAAELFQRAASRGHPAALVALGELYHGGKGVPQSHDRAAQLFQQAASQGGVGATDHLGTLYRDGDGVPQSFERAAELFQQAALLGCSEAQWHLDDLYSDGKGVLKDKERAAARFEQAASQGSVTALDFWVWRPRMARACPRTTPTRQTCMRREQIMAHVSHNSSLPSYTAMAPECHRTRSARGSCSSWRRPGPGAQEALAAL